MIREGTPSSRHIHRFQAFLTAEADGTSAAEEHNLATVYTAVATLSLPNAVAVNADIQLFPFALLLPLQRPSLAVDDPPGAGSRRSRHHRRPI